MSQLRFAMFGAGFWSRFQLPAWREVGGARCVAVYNRTLQKAESLAREFDVPAAYDDAAELLRREKPDFIDVVTGVETHALFVKLAAEHGVNVICQKPMATTLAEAEDMARACREAGVKLLIHENWRWQTPIRALKGVLGTGVIGAPFRARIEMISGFPVFRNQPALKELDQLILADMGSHILDIGRFLFGEARSLYCQTSRVHRNIRGEDVATVLMRMGHGTTVVCHMGYAENYLERDRFPETNIFIEGEKGSLEIGPDYWLRVTTSEGTLATRHPPPRFAWADPAYDIAHASIVPCHADLLQDLQGKGQAETTGEDNLKTVRLVFQAYESAAQDRAILFERLGA